MKIEIENRTVRMSANGKAVSIHWRTEGETEIISFELIEGGIGRSGRLPDIELSEREMLLRHIGNRIEQLCR